MAEEINTFLENCSASIKAENAHSYYFVMGNEASDMDSMVCSLVYAMFKHQTDKKTTYVPLINIPREDFALRTETDWIFQKLGLKKENLLFYPEVESFLENLKEKVHFILVDHNKFAVSQEKYGHLVKEILDHHKDEKLYHHSSLHRVIEMVGSCSSLVAEKLFHNHSPLLQNTVISTLLLGVILLDTVNLDPKYKKVTHKDELYAKKLTEILGWSDEKQKSFFEDLQEKRFDVSSLSTYDLLRADYKQWDMNGVVVGISSCKRSFAEWFEKDQDITRDSERVSVNFKLDILFIMTQFMDSKNNMCRELGIFTKNQKLHDEAIQFLKTTDLELESMNLDQTNLLSQEGKIITFYNQKNVGASRKQLQPFLDQFYASK